jgi:hypothetical protein
MIACLRLVNYFLISLLKSRRQLEAEVVVLWHQLNVLRRAAPPRLRFKSMDRLPDIVSDRDNQRSVVTATSSAARLKTAATNS